MPATEWSRPGSVGPDAVPTPAPSLCGEPVTPRQPRIRDRAVRHCRRPLRRLRLTCSHLASSADDDRLALAITARPRRRPRRRTRRTVRELRACQRRRAPDRGVPARSSRPRPRSQRASGHRRCRLCRGSTSRCRVTHQIATEAPMAIGTTTNDENTNSPPPMFAPVTPAVVIRYPSPRYAASANNGRITATRRRPLPPERVSCTAEARPEMQSAVATSPTARVVPADNSIGRTMKSGAARVSERSPIHHAVAIASAGTATTTAAARS